MEPLVAYFKKKQYKQKVFYFILQKGDPLPSRLEYQIPVGWVWEDEWEMDLGRAVDEEGTTQLCFN